MPRGFLVKRSRRAGGSYRVRPPPGLPPALCPAEETPRVPAPSPEPPQQQQQQQQQQLPQPSAPLAAVWGAGTSDSAAAAAAAASASAAASAAGESQRSARSPASAESFPAGPALAAVEKLPLLPPRTPLPLPLPLALPATSAPPPPLYPALKRAPRAKAPPAKKPKAVRKLSFADEVTTSPVLGLRIKAASEGASEGSRGGAGPPLLGEFVCQLCKEPYADPLALAQHRCSRIVRVEYRCPECHKIFSCPANLASHRRWHKPRPPSAPGPAQDKENSRGQAGPDQHHGAAESSCCRDPRPPPPPPPPPQSRAAQQQQQQQQQLCPSGEAGAADGSSLGAPGGELFLCPYCHKTFRRQAYLRKHLGTHQAPGALGYGGSPPPAQQITFPCHLCGAHFPSADIRDKHRLWHAVREELLLPLGQPEGSVAHGEQQIFSCKHCPSTFFSSPGLTRHINKCHPSENRQVLLLQMPVRPGC